MGLYLEKVRNDDDYKDYNIIFKKNIIGILQTVEHIDYIFIRQISIKKEYQRNGFATKTLKILEKIAKNKNIRFTIATNSQSAICFWEDYLKKHKYKNIKGDTYELIN